MFDEFERLHKLFDIFNEYEGKNNLYTINKNAGIAPVEVDEAIISLLQNAFIAYEKTGGKTNIAMGSVLRLWHEHRTQSFRNNQILTLPDMKELILASNYMNINDIIIDTLAGTVFLTSSSMSIDVGAIAKGYATGIAMEAIVNEGITTALISAGGHVIAHGAPIGHDTWTVGIQNPDSSTPPIIDAVTLKNKTISISGGYERYFEVDNMQFGHIINPETLMPANHFKQVAVIHESSWMADVISTALFILPYDEGIKIAEALNAEVLWISHDNEWFFTSGYKNVSVELGG